MLLSEWLEVEIHRDGQIYKQSFKDGIPTSGLVKAGKTKKTGTKSHLNQIQVFLKQQRHLILIY